MEHSARRYRGPLRAVVFDWSGTTVDYGSYAPVAAFIEVFRQHGVTLTPEEVRRPMGLGKKDHIRALVTTDNVQQQWQTVHHRPCTEADIDALYQATIPMHEQAALDYGFLVPGVADMVKECRARQLKIGSCTGYSRSIMERLVPLAAARGYSPDTWVCPDDVPAGRPAPWMIFQNAMRLDCYPLAALVKVGDTLADIAEGLNAQMWTVAVAKSGNELGLTLPEVNSLDTETLAARLASIYRRMYDAGAHYVIDSVEDLPLILDEIEARLREGEQP